MEPKIDKEDADAGRAEDKVNVPRIHSPTPRLKSCVCPLFLPYAFVGFVEPKLHEEGADAGRAEDKVNVPRIYSPLPTKILCISLILT